MTNIKRSKTGSEQPLSIKNVILPIVSVSIGMFMILLDSTAINVMQPKLMKIFNCSLSTIQWSVTAYTLALSAMIPLAGLLAEKYGAKTIFLICVLLFTLGSLLCSFATTAEQLVLFRVIQGLGGGMVSPVAIALTYRVSPPDKIGRIMAVLGIPMLLAPAGGPVLAGWLMDVFSWQLVFLINLPIGIFAILFGLKVLPKFEGKSRPRFDIPGMILAPLAFSALAYGISSGGVSWTSIKTISGLIVGLVALALFIAVELKKPHPLLELRVFASSQFRKAIGVQWLFQISMIGMFFLIPIYLQQSGGYSAMQAGLITLPIPISCTVFMQIGGRIFDKSGVRAAAVSGLGMFVSGAAILSFFHAESIAFKIIPLVLLGSGMGMCMMSINTNVLQCAPMKLIHRVTSLSNAAQQIMSSFAVAGATSVFTLRMSHYAVSSDVSRATGSAYGDTFLAIAIVALIGIFISLSFKKGKVNIDAEGMFEPAAVPE